jgi:hypothetical protein
MIPFQSCDFLRKECEDRLPEIDGRVHSRDPETRDYPLEAASLRRFMILSLVV